MPSDSLTVSELKSERGYGTSTVHCPARAAWSVAEVEEVEMQLVQLTSTGLLRWMVPHLRGGMATSLQGRRLRGGAQRVREPPPRRCSSL